MDVIKTDVVFNEDLLALLRQNLRIPDGMDVDLVKFYLKAALDHVENQTGQNLTSKTVTQIWSLSQKCYHLKFKACTINSVTINDEDVSDKVVYSMDTETGVLFIEDVSYTGTDLIKVSYQTDADEINYDIQSLVLAVASNMYNNPEGLPQQDVKKMNMLTNMYQR